MSRVYETVLLVFLLMVMVVVMVAVLTSSFSSEDNQVVRASYIECVHSLGAFPFALAQIYFLKSACVQFS